MDQSRCPGQDMRYWKPEDVFNVSCPHCKTEVEFFKDDASLRCPSCRGRVRNPKIDLGCAKWCEFAEQCLGEARDSDDVKSLCERLVARMKETFGSDRRRIDHALKVLGHAETIQEAEGGDPLTVRAAAILHDIDTREFRIVWDADWLVNISDEHVGASREELAKLIARVFKTRLGRTLAEELFFV